MKNIFDLYKKESFTEEDNKLIDEAIENEDIETDDIIDDWRGWQAENQRLCNEVLEYLKIQKSHFVGISLGTILIRQLAEMYPERVQSMILGGAILKMNFRSQILMKIGNIFKYVLPYLVLYRFFAFVIMPKKNHKQSRLLFINEAKKLYQKEFIKWFKLTAEINPVLKWFRQVELNIPTLYVMGNEDYMFLPSVRKVVEKHYKSSKLFVVEQCGHVVNVEQPNIFNKNVLAFLKTVA